ncbi:hypothetical protein C8J57DRAFT_1052863 [Mycena rebaudengoi]|nr:hypothetical protein C8J57DRAFT_1052863 [Mycena rebaudengoi]
MRPTQLLLKSGRSAWKGPYFVAFPNLKEAKETHMPIKTQARACTILPTFVGIRFLVHNGKDYIPVMVSQDMVGHKLGEFANTKKTVPMEVSALLHRRFVSNLPPIKGTRALYGKKAPWLKLNIYVF